jgi:hypothetical protein
MSIDITKKSQVESAINGTFARLETDIINTYMARARALAIEMGLEINDTTGSRYNKIIPVKGTSEQINAFKRRLQYMKININLENK